MKKILDSDWLRAVLSKCNTSAKSVTPVQITHHNYKWLKDNRKRSKPVISHIMMTKILYENFEKNFSNEKK